jgi:hypothetical protein
MPDPTETPPEEQIAEVQATIERQRRWAGALLRPVWDVLARLAALMAALWRRLPPE